jgi:hypothetical protein
MNSTGFTLDGLNPIQKLEGIKVRLQFDNIIYKPILIFVINRVGSVNRRLNLQSGVVTR